MIHPHAIVKDSPTVKSNEVSNQMIAEGRKVYKFGLGQSPFPVYPPVVEALIQHAAEKDYLPVQGLLSLREAVAKHFQVLTGVDATADQVMIGPGSKELLFGVQLCFNGDLMLPRGSWVSYEPQAQLVHKKVHWIDTEEKDGYVIQPEVLERHCKALEGRWGLLLLNYPNNPTGKTISPDHLQKIAAVVERYNVVVLSDEIYGQVNHQRNHQSIVKYIPDRTIVTGGISKWCGAGGYRLGTMVIPSALDEIRKAMIGIASETFTSVSAPIQYASIVAFQIDPLMAVYLQAQVNVLSIIGKVLYERFTQIGLTLPYPEGGFYLFPNFEVYRDRLAKKGINNSQALVDHLLQESGVMVLAGSHFGLHPHQLVIRLSYVNFDGERALDIAMRRIDEGARLTLEDIAPFITLTIEAMEAMVDWCEKLPNLV